MNWITRCPECATVYQASPDQLEAARGWLRCGQCQHVFDSTGLILAWSGPAPAPANAVLDAPAATPERLDVDALLKRKDSPPASGNTTSSENLASFEAALSSFKPAIEEAITQLSATAAAAAAGAHADDDAQTTDSPEAFAPARRQGPSVLWVWLLLLGFFVQWLWVDRHALTARWPALDLPFKAVCHAIACESEFLRDANAMVIDSSSFIQHAQEHELTWTVRNSSERALKMTALELTLQDAQGAPVVRRVLWPAQVDAPEVLMPGQSWTGRLFMRVDADVPVSGYRVLSFYP
ncbi:MAG: zinc-ribbon and DUF3426 domain-containing protein [Limnohabitans sp.]